MKSAGNRSMFPVDLGQTTHRRRSCSREGPLGSRESQANGPKLLSAAVAPLGFGGHSNRNFRAHAWTGAKLRVIRRENKERDRGQLAASIHGHAYREFRRL